MVEAASIKGARVLIVEDEYFIAYDLARALEQAGGTLVGPVSMIEQAEDIIRRNRVDAAIFDLNLRGETASGLIERLAETKLPCLIVSGYGDDALPDTLSNIPRLEKPVSPALVIQKLADEMAAAH